MIYDHRVLDGATVARALAAIEDALKGPVLAELEAASTAGRRGQRSSGRREPGLPAGAKDNRRADQRGHGHQRHCADRRTLHSTPTAALEIKSPMPLTVASTPKPMPRDSAGKSSAAVAFSSVSQTPM